MKSYADEGVLTESAQPTTQIVKGIIGNPGRGEFIFGRIRNPKEMLCKTHRKPSKCIALHANFTNAANSAIKKGDSEEPPFTPYSSASQMAAFTALCQPFRRAARFASSISGRNTRSTSLFSMMSSVES